MSDAIGPGDWVQAIYETDDAGPKKGTVWLVLAVVRNDSQCWYGARGDHVCPTGGLILSGLSYDAEEPCDCAACYRPYQGPEQASRLTCEPVDADQMATGWRGLGK